MQRGMKTIFFAVVWLAVLGMLAAAGTPAANAAENKVITIYAMGDYSGPYGGLTTPGLAATRDVMKYWQDNNLIPGAK
ncbi:MAG: hypothetical protein P8182_05935, partial [Deltaproteobacteria bacterium]